ncbi:hypothetical protein A3K73_00495 [Candidatus Pacearchaeota archaeon RBG_13_36_9]|nr:MAG: hypothetical protein A3K73_00495 [Candidatus Pacearchaeota archaeon RBG_13_36_9]
MKLFKYFRKGKKPEPKDSCQEIYFYPYPHVIDINEFGIHLNGEDSQKKKVYLRICVGNKKELAEFFRDLRHKISFDNQYHLKQIEEATLERKNIEGILNDPEVK